MKIKPRVMVLLGWYTPEMIRSIGHYARDAGWHLEIRHLFNSTVPALWRGEGFIASRPDRPDLLEFIRRQARRQPTVLVGSENLGFAAPQVRGDDRAAGRLAALHFLDQGHKHFVWYSWGSEFLKAERRDGFVECLAEAGYRCTLLERRPQRGRMTKWLAEALRPLPRPLACYAVDDLYAAEVIEACVLCGWRVPEEVAVIGTGNIEMACECSHVPISSVDLNDEAVGRQACAILARLMSGCAGPPRPLVVPPVGVVVRRSSDWLALIDPALRKAVDCIHGNLHRPLSLDQVAQAGGVSRRTLYTLFRRDLRCTPAEFVLERRLKLARQLLAQPEVNVRDTAARCGFGSSRTLTRQFRRHEGKTARDWRRSRLAKDLPPAPRRS